MIILRRVPAKRYFFSFSQRVGFHPALKLFAKGTVLTFQMMSDSSLIYKQKSVIFTLSRAKKIFNIIIYNYEH